MSRSDQDSSSRPKRYTAEDVTAARALLARHPALSARDLLHLAICQRHSATRVLTYDRQFAAAFAD
jgi:predicted nucleic acid-binding protein